MRFTKLILFVVGLLIACAPLSLPESINQSTASPTPQSEKAVEVDEISQDMPQETPAEETAESLQNLPTTLPTEEQTPAVNEGPSTPSPESTGEEQRVELRWNSPPEALVVRATFCCGGYAPELAVLNYIPDAQIWGDGRIIWTEYTDTGSRQVLTEQLTLEQREALLQHMADVGFFDWQDSYADRTMTDAANKCIFLELEYMSKTVCEYGQGAPQAFHDLYAYIASGLAITGNDYIPPQGYLTAYPLDLTNQPTLQAEQQWPADSLGFSLSQAENGAWIKGPALEWAWERVNAQPSGTVIKEGDAYYQISLQIPEVSQTEPPAP